MASKVVFMHGFTAEEAFAAMRAVKAASADPDDIAFSMSTPNNVEWTVKDLIEELGREHEAMRRRSAATAKSEPRAGEAQGGEA